MVNADADPMLAARRSALDLALPPYQHVKPAAQHGDLRDELPAPERKAEGHDAGRSGARADAEPSRTVRVVASRPGDASPTGGWQPAATALSRIPAHAQTMSRNAAPALSEWRAPWARSAKEDISPPFPGRHRLQRRNGAVS
jgi:hypothetical protein